MSEKDVVLRDVDALTWATLKEQATMLVKSGFLPRAVDTTEKAIAIALKGRELGLPLMQSITSIHVIDGKPTISAELMAALVLQRVPGAVLRCVETTNERCTYEAGRPGDKILRMSFTWQDAVTAGVTGKMNWKQYPAAMLRARCCSAICRIVFPDAIMGCYTPDELGAITTEEGDPHETINISGNKPIQQPQAKSEQKTNDLGDPAPDEEGCFTIDSVVQDVQQQKGKKGDKEWTKYHIQAGGEKYSTFDKKVAEDAKKSSEMSIIVTMRYKKSQYGNDIVSLTMPEDVPLPGMKGEAAA